MSKSGNPTSPEQYLEDVLYNYQALQEMSPAEPEWALVGDQIFDDCSVFQDQYTGTQIVLTRLPEDQGDFLGGRILLSNYKTPIIVPVGEQTIAANEVHIQVTSDLRAYVSYLISDRRSGKLQFSHWLKGDAEQIAQMLDMPTTKPFPKSERDTRVAPPIIEREQPKYRSPRTLYRFLNIQLNSDLLRVPSDALYTHLCSQFDHLDESTSASGLIVREGVSSSINGNSYRMEVVETQPEDSIAGIIDNVEDFEREFDIVYESTSGPISIGTRMLGTDEYAMIKANRFEFSLKRDGLIQYASINGREILLDPHISVMYILYDAMLSGQDLRFPDSQ